MAVSHDGVEDDADPILEAAKAANTAARDAETAARSAAATALAAKEAVAAADQVAFRASRATASAADAAAMTRAEIAASAAAAIEAEAVARAVEVAASAETAMETVAAENRDEYAVDGASRAASSVAATVADDVLVQARATSDAAATVAAAVTSAAQDAARAAAAAAATVDSAAGNAAITGRIVAGWTAATQAASNVAVGSARHMVEAAARLRLVTAARIDVARRQASLASDLHRALGRKELALHYQPVYRMDTGALVAVEALLRWHHPTRGLLHPGDFLDVAEGSTLIIPIGDWVLATAVQQADTWRREFGVQAPDMWVNVTGDQLGRRHLDGVVEKLLSKTGLPPAKLGLEVTERQLIRSADAVAADLRALRALGVSLAVDDFGTGYASLDYLRQFPFDEIKIDRSFVAGLGHDRTDTAVTAAIIALGRSLDLIVVAEGVETQAQFDHLHDLGCDRSQGYLLHRPAPPDVIGKLLSSG
jgi:EAL domain-containing protein (putative c-di-GMP-specific phosphodiesterase class I)